MDERLLQQLEEMETELEAFQSALESIEESKELTKESALALKESQVTLSRACEDFIPVLQERFDNFATDSTTVQAKLEDLLAKLQNLDIHQFTEKLDSNGEHLTDQVARRLNSQNENLINAINAATTSIEKHTQNSIENATAAIEKQIETSSKNNISSYITPLSEKLEIIKHDIETSQDTTATMIEDHFANQTNLTQPISEIIIAIESVVDKHTGLINSISERIASQEDEIKTTKKLIKQIYAIGIIILAFSFTSAALSVIKFCI